MVIRAAILAAPFLESRLDRKGESRRSLKLNGPRVRTYKSVPVKIGSLMAFVSAELIVEAIMMYRKVIVFVELATIRHLGGNLRLKYIPSYQRLMRGAIDRPRHVSSLSDASLMLLVDPRIGALQSEMSVD
jgi:hypothetical protein